MHTFDSTNQIASNPPAQKSASSAVQCSIVEIFFPKKQRGTAGAKKASLELSTSLEIYFKIQRYGGFESDNNR
jgi:hypothetical protein